MAARLGAAGISFDVYIEPYPNVRFARLHEPEGNPVELWELPGDMPLRLVSEQADASSLGFSPLPIRAPVQCAWANAPNSFFPGYYLRRPVAIV